MRIPFDLPVVLNIPRLAEYLEQVDGALLQSIDSENRNIAAPIMRLLKSRGKRLRPTLVIATALSGSDTMSSEVLSTSVAIELVHIASLIHDDIIDSSTTRWGLPTINSKEGTSSAIVAGDYLLAKACAVAANVSIEVAQEVANVITVLCEGQSYELADEYNLGRSLESLNRAIRGKTAALMSTSCRVGGICAGLAPERLTALGQYGEQLGFAFQLVDDVLDFVADPQQFGKQTGIDIKAGVYTMPIILSLKGKKNADLRAILQLTGQDNTANITELLIGDESIQKTIAAAREYSRKAMESLSNFDASLPAGLPTLPQKYVQWALTQLVQVKYQYLAR